DFVVGFLLTFRIMAICLELAIFRLVVSPVLCRRLFLDGTLSGLCDVVDFSMARKSISVTSSVSRWHAKLFVLRCRLLDDAQTSLILINYFYSALITIHV